MPHKLFETILQVALSASVLVVTSSTGFPQSSKGSESDPVETVKAAATTWKATYTPRQYVVIRRASLPTTTTVLFMGPNAAAYGKISNPTLNDW